MKETLVIFLLCSAFSFSSITGIKRLEWIDPLGRQSTSYRAWSAKHLDRTHPTHIGRVYERLRADRQNVVNIIVNARIYSDIAPEIDTLTNDLVAAGYSVRLDTTTGMSHTALRMHLANLVNCVGALFVGELPVAWFEHEGEEFPHDLYFCDLDGIYIDADVDGVYDDHTGNVAPEIWVGRVYARNLTWDNEVRLLKNYFHKNHEYRTAGSSLPQRALSFVDDDWDYFETCYLDLIYSNVVVMNDSAQTFASHYRTELTQGYEWIHICAHSSPWGHTFRNGYESGYKGTVFNYEIFTFEPHALFYNLFACSGTRFTEENNSAGWYLFSDPYGLLVVGSTKTGSMLWFEDFYGPIGQQNMCIGEAFKYWFTLWGETSWFWFYGMNILGDPTLKPLQQTDKALTRENYISCYAMTEWSSPEIVATDSESDGFPTITTNTDGKKWLVWESGRSYTNGRSEIYSAYRDETGWSSAMNVGPHEYWDYNPVIGIESAGRPVVVWAGYDNGQYDLYYSIYNDAWSSRQLVTNSDPAYDIKPAMVQDSLGRIWVFWESRRNVNADIYTSWFDGSSWSSPEQVTTNGADETTPHTIIDSLGRLWVLYERKYDDRSEIWGSYYTGSQWISSGPVSGNQQHAYHPTGAVDEDGTLWAVWQSTDGSNPDIYASYFTGATWSPSIQITSSPECDLFPDVVSNDSGVVWLVYQSYADGDWNIYTAHCVDSTWSQPEIVTDVAGADINPCITWSESNRLWVTWQSYATGNWEIMVSHRPEIGILEDKNNYRIHENENFRVSSTLFSQNLKITTRYPHQRVKIFDVYGALVQELFSDANNITTWIPHKVASGVYFIVIDDPHHSRSQKVLYLK
ncbi:MAG: hypothetical protein JSV97_13880 [candidate division WOR-3 bacterium]|nr:MAG: hypothetical protein JSV97_13880 [candidate division WOR-3 bacterium]